MNLLSFDLIVHIIGLFRKVFLKLSKLYWRKVPILRNVIIVVKPPFIMLQKYFFFFAPKIYCFCWFIFFTTENFSFQCQIIAREVIWKFASVWWKTAHMLINMITMASPLFIWLLKYDFWFLIFGMLCNLKNWFVLILIVVWSFRYCQISFGKWQWCWWIGQLWRISFSLCLQSKFFALVFPKENFNLLKLINGRLQQLARSLGRCRVSFWKKCSSRSIGQKTE